MARQGPDLVSTYQKARPHPIMSAIEQAARAHAQAEAQKKQLRSALTALVANTLAQQVAPPSDIAAYAQRVQGVAPPQPSFGDQLGAMQGQVAGQQLPHVGSAPMRRPQPAALGILGQRRPTPTRRRPNPAAMVARYAGGFGY